MRLRSRLGFLAPLAVLSGGCGFHFAGTEPLPEPMRSVYIDLIDPYHVTVPPLESALQARIVRSGGEVKSKIEQAKTVLRLRDLSETQEVLSIGPDGKAIEYRLVTRVTFEVLSGSKQLIAPQSQGLDRAYSFSATEILPKEAEAERLSTYIQNDLADVILLRINAQLSHLPATVDAQASRAVVTKPEPAIDPPSPSVSSP